jgi:ADP-heptose:LPS heptosyltransferase
VKGGYFGKDNSNNNLSKNVTAIKLKHHLAPGDSLVMTACVESLVKAHPGQYRISVDTTCMEIWENNPHVQPWEGGREIELEYPAIHNSHEIATGHFMAAFCSNLSEQLGVQIPLKVNRPSIYLSDQEKADRRIQEPYLIINAGVKSDFTNKFWGSKNYQKVVDHFRGRIACVQIGEAHHQHQELDGVINLVGKTTPRELFSLIYNGISAIGPTTFVQHAHAALSKFYVCILGGREPKHWCDYPTQTTLSTMGQLPCCRESACWKSRTVPLNDGDEKDKSLCALPVISGHQTIPACMNSITPDSVISAVETYIHYL